MIRENSGTIIEVQRVLPTWYHYAFKHNLLAESGIEGLGLPIELNGIHSSEYGWVGINRPDYIVENNSTIDSLHSQAYTILSNIIK
jgi:hypothetical protein